MRKPKYDVGSIIDLRFTHESMPDRIYINMVYMKDKSTQWMYSAFSERKNDIIYVGESQIDALISKKNAKCYENPMIQELYDNGFRFCGNNKEETAFNRANSMVNAKYIKHIILAEAIDTNGEKMPGYLGLWVQYNATISDKAEKSEDGYYIIK